MKSQGDCPHDGTLTPAQRKLFYTNVNLDQRIRPNHPLRHIARLIDFDFVYQEVADTYGTNGNVSVPPPIILKLMVLLSVLQRALGA